MTSHNRKEDSKYSIDRRTALKAAGVAGVGLFTGTSAFSGSVAADDHVAAAIAFIPNSREATVSKVDLVEMEAVARYNTLTADEEDEQDDPEVWRTNRIDIDSDGNGWVLNSATGPDFRSGLNDLTSSVVRVENEGGNPGDDTSGDHDDILEFEDEVRTTSWKVGGLNDMARSISIDENDDIWIGFYGGEYVRKFTLDNGDLVAEGDEITVPGTPYNSVIGNGTLYVSCRDSGTPVDGSSAVVAIDPDDGSVTDLEYDTPGASNPYSVTVDTDGDLWVSEMVAFGNSGADRFLSRYVDGKWENFELNGPTDEDLLQFRGMVEYDGRIWVTADNGYAVGLDPDADPDDLDEDDVEVVDIADGDENPPIGLARDPLGRVWSVLRSDDKDEGSVGLVFDDEDVGERIGVGDGPYAYGDFISIVELGDICGEKTFTDELEAHFQELLDEGIITQEEYDDRFAGWKIELSADDGGEIGEDLASTTTDADGEYCFTDLEPGDYWVCEVSNYGTYVVGDECKQVTVTAGETAGVDDDQDTDFENDLAELQGCTPGFWCNPAQRKGWWSEDEDVGGYYTDDLIGDVFDSGKWQTVEGRGQQDDDVLAGKELGEAVCDLAGGPDLEHAQRQLAGHATAALLNAAHEYISYAMTEDQVIEAVLDALETEDREEILALKDTFDEYNNEGCTLNAFGEVEDGEE